MTLAQAYAVCRAIARREARNFYYAFLALPAPKRNAICAVYAFMRHADDLADDEALPVATRRARMAAWSERWHRFAQSGIAPEGEAPEPVFLALNDARLRFRIPLSLLEQLVEGTAMDLRDGDAPGGAAGQGGNFATFADLYRYCYLVASVVGLVCIRIFEYRGVAAEKLAEELGIAFQLTNILRDVREDAERGRVYLPVDELAEHGFTPATLAAAARGGGKPDPSLRALLAAQAMRAESFYRSGTPLLPLVAADSRPALWVLLTIYHRLLGRIRRAGYDVLSQRVRVPAHAKLLLLGRGLLRTAHARTRGSRTAARVPAPAPQRGRRRVAIVGGGIAGLAAGAALADAGYTVTLFERRPYVGGRASSYLHPGSGKTIDNCQHILLGCCTNLRSLLTRVGRADTIAWTGSITYLEPGGRRSVVRPARLPAPLQSSFSFLGARCFSPADKRAIAHGLRQFLPGYPADVPGGESFLSWARRNGQTPGALKRFWEPILQSALNDDLDRVSVHYAGKVLRDSFLSSAEAGQIGVPLLPLSEMYAGAAGYIQARGGTVHLRTGVRALSRSDAGWQVGFERAGEPGSEAFDDVIVALPSPAARDLFGSLPSGPERDDMQELLGSFEHVPLAGVHLWFDREITELPHAVLLDTTIQWLYQREKLGRGSEHESESRSESGSGAGSVQGSHLELVMSVARKLVPMSQREIIDLALRELALFFPVVHEARLEHAIVTKELRATFSVTPGVDARRPGARTAWPGLFLAGDWTDTGWPATMESAARSGFLAAEALTGGEDQFLVPDLPARGLMRWFG